MMAICSIIFYGCDKTAPEGPVPDGSPAITIEQTTTDIGSDGGEIHISYQINNPAETGSISAKSEAAWVTLSNVTASDIFFNVEKNNDAESRETKVSIVYTFGEHPHDTASSTAIIRQSGKLPEPELIIEPSEIEVDPEGGKSTAEVTVLNPTEDGFLTVSCSEDWISANTDGMEIVINVDENDSVTARNAKITVSYTYSGDKTVNAEIDILQNVPVNVDYYLPDAYVFAEYYDYGEIFRYFRIYFSDMEIIDGEMADGAFKYDLTIYVSGIDDNSNPVPPDGNYLHGSNLKAGQFSGWIYPAFDNSGFGIQDGSMNIKKDGDYLSIETDIIDENGKTHYIKYYGIPSFDIAYQI